MTFGRLFHPRRLRGATLGMATLLATLPLLLAACGGATSTPGSPARP